MRQRVVRLFLNMLQPWSLACFFLMVITFTEPERNLIFLTVKHLDIYYLG
jgi:hypothetical protein